ncbi:MAG: hypothetical protein LIO58_09055 [Oscillospiraceae bacterium]|nr:hypothetical protein [Oscillospiraceae bacterium]
MKKQIGALALTAALGLSLVGCTGSNGSTGGDVSTGEDSAYARYTAATKILEDTTAMEGKSITAMNLVAAGESMDITMDFDIAMIMHSDTDIEMMMGGTADYYGQSMDMNIYYKDGYMYTESQGVKVKTSVPIEEAMSSASLEALDITESAIKSQEVTDVNGDTQVTFVLDGPALGSVVDEMVESMTESLGSGSEVTLGDITYTALIGADGNIKNCVMDMAFDMSVAGETATATMSTSIEYTAFGDSVTIDVPADLDAYIEV